VTSLLYEFSDLIDPQKNCREDGNTFTITLWVLWMEKDAFQCRLKKQDDTKFGWVIDPVFHVTQDKEGAVVLEMLKRVFQCGRIIPKSGQEDTVLQYVVDSRRHLIEVIIPFFNKHKPIIKQRDFKFFKEIVQSLQKGEHKNPEGFMKLVEKSLRNVKRP
jgi:hypothetical protein